MIYMGTEEEPAPC